MDSKSILGLFYGKKCSEIVFFPRCLLNTNRDLTLLCLACIFCRPGRYLRSYFSRRYFVSSRSWWRYATFGVVESESRISRKETSTLLMKTYGKSQESPGKTTAATKKNKLKTSTTRKRKKFALAYKENNMSIWFARDRAQYVWMQLKAHSELFWKQKSKKWKQANKKKNKRKFWKVPKISIFFLFVQFLRYGKMAKNCQFLGELLWFKTQKINSDQVENQFVILRYAEWYDS